MKTIGLKNKNSGFTLIEIIIVVVILGILAAIALPKLTQNIGRSLAAEAFNIGSAYAKAVDRCVSERTGGVAPIAADAAACLTFAQLTAGGYMVTPPVTNFTWGTANVGMTNTLTATAVAARGLATTDTILINVFVDTGAVTRVCNGAFASMCK